MRRWVPSVLRVPAGGVFNIECLVSLSECDRFVPKAEVQAEQHDRLLFGQSGTLLKPELDYLYAIL